MSYAVVREMQVNIFFSKCQMICKCLLGLWFKIINHAGGYLNICSIVKHSFSVVKNFLSIYPLLNVKDFDTTTDLSFSPQNNDSVKCSENKCTNILRSIQQQCLNRSEMTIL